MTTKAHQAEPQQTVGPHVDAASDATQATMHIGVVAERTGLSMRTLRHYDEVGLLTPSARSEGGFRLYTSTDINRLLLIRRMKPLGFTLEEMADLLDTAATLSRDGDDTAARQRLAGYIRSAEERREKLASTLHMADELIALLRAT